MNADEPSARPDVALKSRFLLFGIEDFVVGIIKDDHQVALQILVGEHSGIVGSIHGDFIFSAELFNGGDAGRDVGVDEKMRSNLIFGIDQAAPLGGMGGAGRNEEQAKGRQDCQQQWNLKSEI